MWCPRGMMFAMLKIGCNDDGWMFSSLPLHLNCIVLNGGNGILVAYALMHVYLCLSTGWWIFFFFLCFFFLFLSFSHVCLSMTEPCIILRIGQPINHQPTNQSTDLPCNHCRLRLRYHTPLTNELNLYQPINHATTTTLRTNNGQHRHCHHQQKTTAQILADVTNYLLPPNIELGAFYRDPLT